jgi:energy-coupling factor transporter ATP-binding protein EcfA2
VRNRAVRIAFPSRGQLRQLRRMLQALLALLASALLLLLVFSPQAENFCDGHSVGCGLTTGFISTALILLVGYFFLFTWTLRAARSSYVRVARESPERFFVAPPRLRADPAARGSLTAAVASESAFARRGAPILVVGEAGSGKTTFLLALMRHLAHEGAVPVLVPLRGVSTSLDLRSLAQREFTRNVDPVVRSEGDAQRIWRRLSAEGSIVVLADGLDEVTPGATRNERDYLIRSALAAARNDRLSVVVTSRPEAVPAGAPVSQFELGDLDKEEALRYLRESAYVPGEHDRELLEQVVTAGRMTRTPYYLNIVSSLYRAGRLRSDAGSGDSLLVALLDDWTELVQDERFFEEVELDGSRRRTIVENLGSVAYAMTLDALLDCSGSRLNALLRDADNGIPRPSFDLSMVIEGAARLDLVQAFSTGDDTAVRFNHAISQAYLTSRFLDAVPDAWQRLVERAPSPEMSKALLMWCARDGDRRKAQAVCEALVRRAGTFTDDRALGLVVTAAEIASSIGLPGFREIAQDVEEAAWAQATPRTKVAAVKRLEGRSDEWVYARLYEATRDSNYRVRWSAAGAIIAGGPDAWQALGATFAELLSDAESLSPNEWGEERRHDLSVLGWILPALWGRVEDDTLDRDVERLAALVGRGMPLGTEASLAQGFKLGALVNPAAARSAIARDLVDQCRFWYSRIVLLHAITIAAVSNPGQRDEALALVRATEKDETQHPFVRAAASLCGKAIRHPRDWKRYIWEDESAVIGRSGSMVRSETAALVADIVLLLNVTEQGDVREQRKEDTYRRNDLPHCLSTSKERRELFDGCHVSCTFHLCPYPSTAERWLGRGAFSQAFCRHQIDTLTGLSRIQATWRRKSAGRWSHSGRAALVRFWAEMERRAG